MFRGKIDNQVIHSIMLISRRKYVRQYMFIVFLYNK